MSNILQCQDGLHGESKRATRSQHCLFKGCLLGMGGVGVCCLLVGQGMQAACQGSIVASLRQGQSLVRDLPADAVRDFIKSLLVQLIQWFASALCNL